MTTASPTAARPPELGHFYRLLLADTCQMAVVVRKAFRHDRRLLGGLAEDTRATGGLSEPLEDMLLSLEDELDRYVERPIRKLLAEEAWRHLPIDALLEQRSTISDRLNDVLRRGGPVHRQLRNLVHAAAPDLRQIEGPLIALDARPARAIVEQATSYANVVGEWVGTRPAFDGPLSVRLASDSVFESWIRTHEHFVADDFAVRRVELSLSVPTWLIFLPRYAPLTAHEVMHSFVSLLLGRDLAVRALFDSGARELAAALAPMMPDDDVEHLARYTLTEVLCDVLALEVAGPAYLATLALLGVGIHSPGTSGVVWPPLAVRLTVLDLRLAAGRSLPGFRSAIRAQVTEYLAWRSARTRGFREAFDVMVQVCTGFVNLILAELGPPPLPKGSTDLQRSREALEACLDDVGEWRATVADLTGDVLRLPAALRTPQLLWEMVEKRLFVGAKVENELPRLPEGAVYLSLMTLEQMPDVVLGAPWEMVLASFTRPDGEARWAASRWLEQVARAFGAHEHKESVVAAGMGVGDLVVMQPGFRWRDADSLPDSPFPFVGAFGRRGVLPIHRVLGKSGETVFPWEAVRTEAPHLLTELRLVDPSMAGKLFERLRGLPAVTRGRAVLLRAFQGLSWADIILLWAIRDLGALTELHAELLAGTDAPIVERSVTLMLTHTRMMGQDRAAWNDVSSAAKGQFAVHIAARAQGAARIRPLAKRLRTHESPHPFAVNTFGIADVLASRKLNSGGDVTRLAEELWELRAEGLLARTVCHLSFDLGDAVDPT